VNSLAHQPPQIARANGIDLCYEIFGDAGAEPMLLIMGLGAQMIHWDDDFCRQLAARGFRVIRFDNRDIGKSSHLSGGKRLTAVELLKLRFLKIPVQAPYKLRDMAEDTIGLMDVLGIKSAHVVGLSMGGMIAQEIAISFPQWVRSLTSIMSTTGNPKVPPPTQAAAAIGQGADPGDSRHRRSLGTPRGRQGHRGLDIRCETSDDRRHGSRAADPDVAADHRCDRQACPRGIGEGAALA
jgi:pimeloyl-ACP methyl ester carboxylesterase